MGSSSEKIRSFHAADEGCRFFCVAKIHGSDDGTATSWNYQRNGDQKGITLIVGGGYHGKSTLLKALESGVYNHIAGDGREYVITDDSAVKLRAEDGRSIQKADISMFIQNLPNGKKYNGILYGGCQWKHLAGGKYRRSNGGGINPVFDR